MSGSRAYHSGLRAEEIVERHYADRGMPVVARRWKGQGGEIDLVVCDGAGLIFVEVKKARSRDRAAERVSARQMARICAAAAEYLGTTPAGQATDVRFDVALVDGQGAVEILENAFGA
jgi:putative endonuclease